MHHDATHAQPQPPGFQRPSFRASAPNVAIYIRPAYPTPRSSMTLPDPLYSGPSASNPSFPSHSCASENGSGPTEFGVPTFTLAADRRSEMPQFNCCFEAWPCQGYVGTGTLVWSCLGGQWRKEHLGNKKHTTYRLTPTNSGYA